MRKVSPTFLERVFAEKPVSKFTTLRSVIVHNRFGLTYRSAACGELLVCASKSIKSIIELLGRKFQIKPPAPIPAVADNSPVRTTNSLICSAHL